MNTVFYAVSGYLLGSILFARLFGRWLCKTDISAQSPDGNPGAFNAFRYGGFLCGSLTLVCDILKGFLPVFLYLQSLNRRLGPGLALVLVAPVLGHILPVYSGFSGGKGIAVSFGCLLGLLPAYKPLLVLAACFLLFTMVVRVQSNYYKTIFAYCFAGAGMWFFQENRVVALGFTVIAGLIVGNLLLSGEEREKCKVGLSWRR